MPDLVTLTINPAVDVSTSVNRVKPVHKLRCAAEQRDPGGGGINVARVAQRFAADVVAVFPAGGPIGELLHRLLDREGVRHHSVPIAGDTREDFTVLETDTGEQFRFVVPGPRLGDAEWRGCLAALTALARPRMVVASGSLPPGVPEDFYGQVAQAARQAGAKLVVDTSGAPLRRALDAGCYLVKPSLNEMRELMGEPLDREHDCVMAARRLLDAGRAEVVALTLGHYGALLIAHDRVLRAGALPIRAVSTVGAGDSFLGAMLVRIVGGHDLDDAFRYGVAAGSAALLAPGTDLCRRDDVERLIGDVKVQRLAP